MTIWLPQMSFIIGDMPVNPTFESIIQVNRFKDIYIMIYPREGADLCLRDINSWGKEMVCSGFKATDPKHEKYNW